MSENPGAGEAFIRLRNVVKTYKNAAGEFTALKGIDADFSRGEFVGVIGKSGSGKTTLVNMITGIDRPTSGEVYIGDDPVHLLTENQMSRFRGRNLGIVFQFFQLLPMLSLLENVMLPMDFCRMFNTRERRDRAMELLRMVELHEHAHKLPSAISGGQQQRVAIARSLACDPPAVLADEPTGNLDSQTAETVFMMFETLVKQGKTVIMVTHDSSLARRVTRTMLIADGEVVNEWLVKALPTLSHQDMLTATRKLKPMKFKAGQTIMEQGAPGNDLYIITRGYVEIALKRPGGHDVVVSQLEAGQYFGEIELIKGNSAIASVRAGLLGVEVVAIDRDTFTKLMQESEATRKAISEVVESRSDENSAARKA